MEELGLIALVIQQENRNVQSFIPTFSSNFNKDPEKVVSPLFLSICKILAIFLQRKVCEKL